MGLVSALLALENLDMFRERVRQSNENEADVKVMAICVAVGVCANMICLFLATFYGLMLSLVPKGSVRK